ncbi:MAG: class I SAM-dependent methyltransferase [Candidatus Kapabacteria bacterium]|nr:class I SAM-dependent methyltransferase [Candidatus Kapabacteria bacterium]
MKQQVQQFWNNQACGTQFTDKEKYSKEYFEDIEDLRYRQEPEIFSFAQFTRFRDKKLLEVGVGAGTDFLQWARAGAVVYGIDLTPEAVEHVHHRLSLYGLKAEEIKVADSENIPFPDNFFDIVYSWGVIHHTPDTPKAMREIIRVCKPGGTCKVMIYHRHSLLSYFFWIKYALLKGKPWMSLSKVLWNHMESIGTKAYTIKEVHQMLKMNTIENLKIQPVLTYYDKMTRFNKLFRLCAKLVANLFGYNKVGWFLTIEFNKK